MSRHNQDPKVELDKVELVIWDWYKTLSNRHLYEDLQNTHPGAYEVIQNYFLENKDRIAQWTKGEITYNQMHSEFAKITGVGKEVFDSALAQLAGKFDIDERILPHVEALKERGIKQVIATDNFDVWDEFFLPQYSQYLNQYFVASYNSSKFRILKSKQADDFVKTILKDQQVDAINALLIDDNRDFCAAFAEQGGQTINHENIADLAKTLAELL